MDKKQLNKAIEDRLLKNPEYMPAILANRNHAAQEEHREKMLNIAEAWIEAGKKVSKDILENHSSFTEKQLNSTRSLNERITKALHNNLASVSDKLTSTDSETVKELHGIQLLLESLDKKETVINVEAPETKVLDKTKIIQETKHIQKAVNVLEKIFEKISKKQTGSVFIKNSEPGDAIPVILTDTSRKSFYDAMLQAINSGGGKFPFRNLDGEAKPALLDRNNILLTRAVISKKVKWITDTDFNKGTYANTEVVGTGDDAFLQLEKTINDDDIPYNDVTKYTLSDPNKITVDQDDNNKAKLKISPGVSDDWPFTTPGNYTYNSSKIEVSSGAAKLIQSSLPNNLVGYWKFEDNVLDSSPEGKDGTNYGATFVDGKPALGRCLSFNGIGNYVGVGDVSIPDNITVCLWFKANGDYTTPQAIVCNAQSSPTLIQYGVFFANTNNKIEWLHNGGMPFVTSNTSISDDDWHHVVITKAGSSGNWTVKIYIDGSLDKTTTGITLNSQTTANLSIGQMGSRNVQYFKGLIDEVAIYERALELPEIEEIYNSGEGKYLDEYSTTNPTITNNTGLTFSTALSIFTETATKPTGSEIKYQVSSDDGVTWKWWSGAAWVAITGGQTDSWYYTNESNSASDINTNIGSLAGSGTFKFRAFLHSDAGTVRPELDNIYIAEGTAYSTDDDLYIDTKDTSQIAPATILSWLTTTITNNLPANTDIKLLFSNDGRTSWLTWSGSAWVAPISPTARADATSITDAQTNFSALPKGNGTLDVRLFLYSSDSAVTPDVDNINVTSDAGFETSGTYETNIYASSYLDINWDKVEFTFETPVGTLAVKARASNQTPITGSYGSALISGQDAGVEGKYIQFEVTMTGNGITTPTLDDLSVVFATLEAPVVSP